MKKFELGSYIFVTCQTGAEPALKKELAREHPQFKFAYSRPGFVTFKKEGDKLTNDFALNSVFARSYGLSIAKISAEDGVELEKRAQGLRDFAQEFKAEKIHLWDRDIALPGDEPPDFVANAHSKKLIPLLNGFEINAVAKDGEIILDVIALEEDELWVGLHVHGKNHSAHAGGKPEVHMPKESPSRAYIKLQEGLLWSGAPLEKEDTALELGCAPGGSCYLLLEKGLKVIGVDPGKMDPIVLNSKKFVHIPTPVSGVARKDLPDEIQWVVLDMNVAPGVSLFAVDRLVTRMKDTLLGVLLTVKLNQWKFADEIPQMLEHVRVMGMAQVRATQLASNRQEIFIYGLTRKGALRLSSQQDKSS